MNIAGISLPKQRLTRAGASLAAVVVVYWMYSLIAVPLIEPSIAGAPMSTTSHALSASGASHAARQQSLSDWFKEGDWELNSSKILETSQALLLFQHYTNRQNGQLELKPCTLVFLPSEDAEGEERRRQAIILRAPEGAVLNFDEEFNLSRGKLGKLLGGMLTGEITITSDHKEPGPHDDVHITTRDVELVDNRIQTPHGVRFRVGPNQGYGRRMTIHLEPGKPEAGAIAAPAFQGATSFELAQQVHLRIYPGDADMFPGSKSNAEKSSPQTAEQGPPVDVTCTGPFRFDLRAYHATFNRDVRVVRKEATGDDMLACDMLRIYFEPATTEAAAEAPAEADDAQSFPKLEPSRIEARGGPVSINVPSRGVRAKGDMLEYDLKRRSARLRGEPEAHFMQGANEIRSRELLITTNETNSVDEFMADGPGWLRAVTNEDDGPAEKPEVLEARWGRRMHYRPAGEFMKLSINGGGRVGMQGSGALDGDEIVLWLKEQAPATPGGKPQLQPVQLSAVGRVHIDSPQVSGSMRELGVWFEQKQEAVAVAPLPAPRQPALGSPLGSEPLPAPPDKRESPFARFAKDDADDRYTIDADTLKLRVITAGKKAEIAEAKAEGHVRFAELPSTQPAPQDGQSLLIRGDLVHLDQKQPEQATMLVVGRPAHVSADGVTFSGGTEFEQGEIFLDRAANSIRAPRPDSKLAQPGSMRLPVEDDSLGSERKWARVAWQERMEFDGRRAVFRRGVDATIDGQTIHAETIEVTLTEMVDFQKNSRQTKPKVDQVFCRGGVMLEGKNNDPDAPRSDQRLSARDLVVEATSGDFTASGPGWLTRVAEDDGDSKLSLPGQSTKSESAPFVFLGMRFEGDVTGNLRSRHTTFHDRVRAIYGPVARWEDRLDPDSAGLSAIPPQHMLLMTDELTVADLAGPNEKTSKIVLTALGNTSVEGDTFTAEGARMTYDQAKEMLTFEGDGYSDAVLVNQNQVGGQSNTIRAGKIYYWPVTKRLQIDNVNGLDVTELKRAQVR